MKRPNSKLQAPEKFQATSSNFSARRFGHWCLVFLWSLELGAWNLDAIAQPLSNLVFTVGTTIPICNKLQFFGASLWSLVLGVSLELGAWCLEFGRNRPAAIKFGFHRRHDDSGRESEQLVLRSARRAGTAVARRKTFRRFQQKRFSDQQWHIHPARNDFSANRCQRDQHAAQPIRRAR